MIDRHCAFPLVLFALCGCASDQSLAPVAGLPAEQRLVGTAAGPRGDGGSIDCSFDIRVTLAERRRTSAYTEYTGTAGDQGSGAWTCAPFDIYENGYVDTIGVVRGSWSVVPAAAP